MRVYNRGNNFEPSGKGCLMSTEIRPPQKNLKAKSGAEDKDGHEKKKSRKSSLIKVSAEIRK